MKSFVQLGFSSDWVVTDQSPVQYWFIKIVTDIYTENDGID